MCESVKEWMKIQIQIRYFWLFTYLLTIIYFSKTFQHCFKWQTLRGCCAEVRGMWAQCPNLNNRHICRGENGRFLSRLSLGCVPYVSRRRVVFTKILIIGNYSTKTNPQLSEQNIHNLRKNAPLSQNVFCKKIQQTSAVFLRSRFHFVWLSYFWWFSQITGTTKTASNTMPTIIVILFIMSKF